MVWIELKRILLRRRLLFVIAGSLLFAVREVLGGHTRAQVPGLFGVISNSLGGTEAYAVIAGVVSADSLAADLKSGHMGLLLSRRISRRSYLLAKSAAMFLGAALASCIHHLCLLMVAAVLLPWRHSLTFDGQMERYAQGLYWTFRSIPGPVPELCFTNPVLNDVLIIVMTSVGAGALATLGLVVASAGGRAYAAVGAPILTYLMLVLLCRGEYRFLSPEAHLNVWFVHRLEPPRAYHALTWLTYWSAMIVSATWLSVFLASKREIGLRDVS
jgi:hypothetical protein